MNEFVIKNGFISQGTSYVSDGNLGVGVTSPTSRLEVKGLDSSLSNFGLKVKDSGGTDNFVVRNDGKVGINTSNPSYQLEVLPKDLTGATQVVIRNTSTSPNWTPVSLSVTDGSGYGVSMSNSVNGVDSTLLINSGIYSYLVHAVNGVAVAELVTAGDSLLWRLPDNFNFRRRATNGDWINFNSLNQRVSIFNETIGGATISARLSLRGDTNTSSSYSLVIQNSGGTNTLVARDDGNVGIGTSTPSEKLEVVGKTKTTNFQMTSGGTEDYILTSSDSQGNGKWTPSYNLSTKDYGSFYDTTTQTGGNGTIQSFQLNSSGATKGISIIDLTGITVTHTGVYNIQFSAQLKNDGGTKHTIFIWLMKNGLDISNTNTGIELGNNNTNFVAAWNFVEKFNSNDVINLMWYSPSIDVSILYDATPTAGPEIPSLILTITQI